MPHLHLWVDCFSWLIPSHPTERAEFHKSKSEAETTGNQRRGNLGQLKCCSEALGRQLQKGVEKVKWTPFAHIVVFSILSNTQERNGSSQNFRTDSEVGKLSFPRLMQSSCCGEGKEIGKRKRNRKFRSRAQYPTQTDNSKSRRRVAV